MGQQVGFSTSPRQHVRLDLYRPKSNRGGRCICARLGLKSKQTRARHDRHHGCNPGRRSRSTAFITSLRSDFALYMFHYYWTGAGGPTVLAMTLIPSLMCCSPCNRVAPKRLLSESADRRELRDRDRLLPVLALLLLLHEHQVHGARHGA